MLEYTFFRNALIALIILSIGGGLLGSYIITRRLVSISGGITHACFGGLGLGHFLGWSPIGMAMIFAIASALGVQWLGNNGKTREDSAIAVVWAAGMAIGITFVFLTPGTVPELNSFLFGNILMVTRTDIALFATYTLSLGLYYLLCFRKITACAFDSDFMQVAGVRTWLYNGVMMLFVAIGIVLMIRCVGIMLLMSLLTLPTLTAERFCRSLTSIIPTAIATSAIGSLGGLFLATVINVPVSALIVAIQVAIYAIASLVSARINL